jgi:serine/threonine protein kinase
VNDSHEAVLADFGLANVSAGLENTITISEGSARWSAPELLMGDSIARTHLSDIYSFGCVCIEVSWVLYSSSPCFIELRLGIYEKGAVCRGVERLRRY